MEKMRYKYVKDEHYPIEHLVYQVDPEHLQECLDADHDLWTLGIAMHEEFDHIPFLYKEVWVNENRPGEIHYIFAWESRESWKRMAKHDDVLETRFYEKFTLPYKMVRCIQEEENYGIHRYSRFERIDD